MSTHRVTLATSSVITPTALGRLFLGWGGVLVLFLASPLLPDPVPGPLLAVILLVIISLIIICAQGVATEADHLARRLGDPYGTLILTLSVVLVEVALISAVMLGPGPADAHATMARDSVMAAAMIVLNLVLGISLIVGDLRHRQLRVNRAGVFTYLSLLIVLITAAFAVPAFLGTTGGYSTPQAIVVILFAVLLYASFLVRQTGAQAADFQEISTGELARIEIVEQETPARRPGENKTEIIQRTLLLVSTVVPIVLLAHEMASFLNDAVTRLNAPAALPGILVAVIVFLPEAVTTVRAAAAGQAQRMSNLAHGALVSCVGLTLPVVLTIGLFTGHTVILAESPLNLFLLGASLLLNVATFSSPRGTASHGIAHLFLFAVYVLSIFA